MSDPVGYFNGESTIYHGDCRDVLPILGNLDACVTDPPYGLEFMGKGWDGAVPPPDLWAAIARTLKPGSYLLAFGGTRTWHRLACAIEDGGFKLQDSLMWLHGQGFPKGKTQLKPAWEPILLAYKPGPRTLNVDECRIGTSKNVPASPSKHADTLTHGKFGAEDGTAGGFDPDLGRWPANLLLDEEAARMLDEQTSELHRAGNLGGTPRRKPGDSGIYGRWNDDLMAPDFGDAGGASRFFYTSKTASAERHYAGKNSHPTVKPVDLMRWLCRLVTPKGGLILDPFTGSGSTGVAALSEGFRFLGIEREAEYVELARRRISGPLFAGASA